MWSVVWVWLFEKYVGGLFIMHTYYIIIILALIVIERSVSPCFVKTFCSFGGFVFLDAELGSSAAFY